ncbi:MAG: hypothetical protein AAF799_02370 [Myxococcota bacterium]
MTERRPRAHLLAPVLLAIGSYGSACNTPPENVGSIHETEDPPATTGDASMCGTDCETSSIPDIPADTSDIDPTAGCEKVDFLFVVDTSGSMDEEQLNLEASVPGFLAQIEQSVATDYRIMVIDHDAGPDYCEIINDGTDDCTPWCESECPLGCDCWCGLGIDFENLPPEAACAVPDIDECALVLGSGITADTYGHSCGLEGGNRYIDQDHPSLASTFGCLTQISLAGHDAETPVAALIAALGPQEQVGGCNEGFLRDDALLVVTLITDEDDQESVGSPEQWRDTLLALKSGDDPEGGSRAEDRVALLSIIADGGQPGSSCDPAQSAARLQAFTDAMHHGTVGSVCASDYGPFFAQAIDVVDTACSEFVPVG